MSAEQVRPFESIESAHEFILLLKDRIQEAMADVREHLEQADASQDQRRSQALRLALFKMNQLSSHMHKSRRVLNDLRTIRRLLFGERAAAAE